MDKRARRELRRLRRKVIKEMRKMHGEAMRGKDQMPNILGILSALIGLLEFREKVRK